MTSWTTVAAALLRERRVEVGAQAHRAARCPLIAAIRSSQTPVGWLEIRLPPGSAAALADHSRVHVHLGAGVRVVDLGRRWGRGGGVGLGVVALVARWSRRRRCR